MLRLGAETNVQQNKVGVQAQLGENPSCETGGHLFEPPLPHLQNGITTQRCREDFMRSCMFTPSEFTTYN